jgi:hypothetical protein
MIVSDAIGLVFRLKAENDTGDEIKKVKKDIDDLSQSGDATGKGGLSSLADKLGLRKF